MKFSSLNTITSSSRRTRETKTFRAIYKRDRTFPGFTVLQCPWRIPAFIRSNNIDTELRYLFRVV